MKGIVDKVLLPQMYKDLSKLNNKKTAQFKNEP